MLVGAGPVEIVGRAVVDPVGAGTYGCPVGRGPLPAGARPIVVPPLVDVSPFADEGPYVTSDPSGGGENRECVDDEVSGCATLVILTTGGSDGFESEPDG